MHMVGCVCPWNFGTKFFLRRGECETPRKSNFLRKNPIFPFLKKGKIVILEKKSEIFLDLG